MVNKKKRGRPDIEELLARPWCYYCERDFDDLKILIDHQRAKHFKCDRCHRRLNTAGGLSVHLNQVHKETLTTIENALPNRSNLDVEIFGTEGIPPDVADAHRQRVLTQYAQAEAERRAATGNPAPGGVGGDNAAKKQKVESKDDIKKKLAEFKARKAAGLQQQGDSALNSPTTPGPMDQQHAIPSQQAPPGGPTPPFGAFPQPYGGPPPGFQPPLSFSSPQGVPGVTSPPAPFVQSFPPPQQFAHVPHQPYANANPMMGGYAPPGQFPGGPPPGSFPGGPQRPYGAQSPPMPYGQQGQFQPPRMNTPPQGGPPFAPGQAHNGAMSPAGLPQRPVSGAPPVKQAMMQQIHQGQYNPQQHSFTRQKNGSAEDSATGTPAPQISTPVAEPTPAPQPKANAEPAPKKAKKEEKGIRMVYSDNEVSPEEKKAKLSRYVFTRDTSIKTVQDSSALATAGVAAAGFGHPDHEVHDTS